MPIVSYNERLTYLGLLRLEKRRIINDLVETFKLCKGYSCLNTSKYLCFASNHSTRGHPYKLFVHRMNNRVHRHFLFNRVINIWNLIPSHYFNTNLISCFKSKLQTFDFFAYMLGRI